MSGGSYDYEYQRIENAYKGSIPVQYKELEDMIVDLCEVLHDLEWWQSCDTNEEDFKKSYNKFRKKWLGKQWVKGYDTAMNTIKERLKDVLEEKK